MTVKWFLFSILSTKKTLTELDLIWENIRQFNILHISKLVYRIEDSGRISIRTFNWVYDLLKGGLVDDQLIFI